MSSEIQKRLTSCILSILDGTESLGQVCIIATSSHPNIIDPAMRRPGRIDQEIELMVPTPSERQEILECILKRFRVNIRNTPAHAHLKQISTSESHVLKISLKAHGMVASDLQLLCKEAVAEAVAQSDTDIISISEKHFDMALARVVPSAMREIAVDVPNTKWSDIGGMQAVKSAVIEVLFSHLCTSNKFPLHSRL